MPGLLQECGRGFRLALLVGKFDQRNPGSRLIGVLIAGLQEHLVSAVGLLLGQEGFRTEGRDVGVRGVDLGSLRQDLVHFPPVALLGGQTEVAEEQGSGQESPTGGGFAGQRHQLAKPVHGGRPVAASQQGDPSRNQAALDRASRVTASVHEVNCCSGSPSFS